MGEKEDIMGFRFVDRHGNKYFCIMHPFSNSTTSPRIAIIGGGIAGLAAAHRALELSPEAAIALFEAGPRVGGVLSTLHRDGFQVERSADNFITTIPWGIDLCRRLGLEDQLIQTNPAYRRTFVVRRGRLHRLPDGFLMMAPTQMWPLAVTPILSPLGKLRSALEYFLPPRKSDADESMASFVRRRLGREAYDRLVEPLVSAVYAADLEKLSLQATLSRFREMEREHGSLIRAMRSQMKAKPKTTSESGARYSMFVTLREGLSSMIDALAASLPPNCIRLDSPVEKIERKGGGWKISVKESRTIESETNETFDAVVLAAPSPVAAKLLAPLHAELAAELAAIQHSGTAIVSLGYDDHQIGHPLDGMGAVVPAIERSPLLAISFSSRKYAHRAPEGKTLLRVFVGGARRPELAEMPDADLLPLVREHTEKLLRITGAPVFIDIAHWPGTMPQYHVGHKDRVVRIRSLLTQLPSLELAGNAYSGVGVPDCIHSGETAIERLL
jgi:oxygen-dependent protoporphyrinogen oxidase